MRSMTGYGKGVVSKKGILVKVELRGLNQKSLDIQVKIPQLLLFIEGRIREMIRENVERGRVEAYITYQILSPDLFKIVLSRGIIKNLAKEIKPLQKEGIIKESLTFSDLKDIPEFLSYEFSENAFETFKKNVEEATKRALKEFNNQKVSEGKRLKEQFLKSLNDSFELLKEIESFEKVQKNMVSEKFKRNIKDLNNNLNEQKVEMEAVLLSEKSDIKEEVVRIKSHLIALKNLLEEKIGEKGRKIDFLLQELQREISTLLAKSALIEITKLGLDFRTLIEQLREQVQNVE
jgi:uncharacterized protein (TIGR00255 family)